MRGGWSGFGMVTVGMDPNDFNLNPNKIPTEGVVQNCPCNIVSTVSICNETRNRKELKGKGKEQKRSEKNAEERKRTEKERKRNGKEIQTNN